MHRRLRRHLATIAVLVPLLLASIATAGVPPVGPPPATPSAGKEVAVVASGLVNPRGVTWDADGTLYVALAGTGGSTPGEPPVPPPLGPFSGGTTASIVRIGDACPVPLASALPSAIDGYGNAYGVASLAFLDGRLYALFAGGGRIKGNPDTPSGVYEVLDDGSTQLVADLGAFVRANPVAGPLPWDYGPEGEPFAMIAHRDRLWVVEANSGQLLTATLDGTFARVADLSMDHQVPTGLAAAADGGVYVGFMSPAPFRDGAAKVVHVTADGVVTDVWTGLTAVTALAVGPDGELYALEMATGNLDFFPWTLPWTGRVVRQTGPSTAEPVATGLLYPVAMAFGPDGGLYVSFPAIGLFGGSGAIIHLDVTSGQSVTVGRSLPRSGECRAGTPVTVGGHERELASWTGHV